jgi:hypothetical protein
VLAILVAGGLAATRHVAKASIYDDPRFKIVGTLSERTLIDFAEAIAAGALGAMSVVQIVDAMIRCHGFRRCSHAHWIVAAGFLMMTAGAFLPGGKIGSTIVASGIILGIGGHVLLIRQEMHGKIRRMFRYEPNSTKPQSVKLGTTDTWEGYS